MFWRVEVNTFGVILPVFVTLPKALGCIFLWEKTCLVWEYISIKKNVLWFNTEFSVYVTLPAGWCTFTCLTLSFHCGLFSWGDTYFQCCSLIYKYSKVTLKSARSLHLWVNYLFLNVNLLIRINACRGICLAVLQSNGNAKMSCWVYVAFLAC